MELAPSGGGNNNLEMANKTSESSQSKEVIQLEGGGERRVEQSSSVQTEQRVAQSVSVVQNGQETNGLTDSTTSQETESPAPAAPSTETQAPPEEQTSANPPLQQSLSEEELQSFPPAQARLWEPPPPSIQTSQLQSQSTVWESSFEQSSTAQQTLQQSVWQPSQQAATLEAPLEPSTAPLEPSKAPLDTTADTPIWSAITQTNQWQNQPSQLPPVAKPWQSQPRPQSWHMQDQPTETVEPQWRPVRSPAPGLLTASAEPIRASSEPKQQPLDQAQLKQWQQFPQKLWREEWQEQQEKAKKIEVPANEVEARKGSDLPQESIRTSLNEIISDIEKAVDLTADLSLGDRQVESSAGDVRTEEPKLTNGSEDSSTIPPERLQNKLERQTSTTSLERVLISQHSKIARELNQVLGNIKDGESDGKTDNTQQDENRHPWNPDGLHHKALDLEKLFTPASDSGEVTPSRNRRMFASSSFYAPNHPTVEEQVELARRISASLSDISNQRSKGQTMYVHRKKRSVKWVHEAAEDGARASAPPTPAADDKGGADKPVLKLIMDPRGAVQDLSSLRRQGVNVEPALSPEVCFDLVRDLNAPKGKGAELFAKRRKKSEKWVVDETTVKTTSTTTTTGSSSGSMPMPVASYLSDGAAKAQSITKMNEIQEKFAQPRLRLIKSPWDAALETGSVDGAFVETPTPLSKTPTPMSNGGPQLPPPSPARTPTPSLAAPTWTATATASTTTTRLAGATSGASGLYQPRAPRGWGSPSATTPTFGMSGNGLQSFRAPDEPAPLLLREAACSGSSAPTTNGAPAVPPRSVFLDYSNFHNYNTAPRGWGSAMDYYRPVTFSKPIAASDF